VTGVTVVGVRGHLVAVEAHVGRGLPSRALTGPPEAGVQAPACWRSFRVHERTLAHHGVLFHPDPLEGFGLSAEDSAPLHAIMMIGHATARSSWASARGG
jgi:hypothetical protein